MRGRAEVARQAQYRLIHCDESVYVDELEKSFLIRDSGISSSKGSNPFIDTNLEVVGSIPTPATHHHSHKVNLGLKYNRVTPWEDNYGQRRL